jgi:6,7-dimethyl-8-ribityllumazine synthase
MSKDAPDPSNAPVPREARVAIVAARFNEEIVKALIDGCLARLAELGANPGLVEMHRVPGAFELPLAAKLLAETGRFAAVICLGCVIRGDTPHFDYVAGSCAHGIAQAAMETRLPIIFGVLTTDTQEQAWQRAGRDSAGAAGQGHDHGHAGRRAADAAAEMIALLRQIAANRK